MPAPNPNTIIYWIRSVGPSGKDRVPMYFKRRLTRRTNEGEAGDIQARPVSLGPGNYTATYNGHDFENEDGTRF